MKRKTNLVLFAKGVCMGVADVIPGVSGGTLALILGIYEQFIAAIKSVNPSPVLAALRWVASGFKVDKKEALLKSLETIHLRFLIPLGCGIAMAIGAGSVVVPRLMESFPEIMRGLFFGLILASIAVPYKMMPKENRGQLALGLLLAVVAAVGGYFATDPNTTANFSNEWVPIVFEADAKEATLKDTIRTGPSALTAEQVYWSEKNASLREAVQKHSPDKAAELQKLRDQATGVVATDKHAIKALSVPYNDIMVPPGTTLYVPRPPYWFVFVAGTIAICAMVLPGVSGSFLLLVFGIYYFILNALKGIPAQLIEGTIPTESILYVGIFITGLAVGITSFARVMSFMLKRFPAPTMGALVGLMIGCLRALWPYQQTVSGTISNVLPTAWGGTEIAALLAIGAGAGIVVALSTVSNKISGQDATA